MTPSHHLFELIKSLNKGEKGYFKKYSQLHTVGDKNNYLILFDAIEKQKKYDEEKILKALSKHSFIRHFSDLKNYLYTLILDSLESYYKNLDVNIKVRREIT